MQLVKSFEITNTLADVVLCSVAFAGAEPSHLEARIGGQCRPSDFLHDLFQTISPFLKDDKILDGVLREKVGQALWQRSCRVAHALGIHQQDENQAASEAAQHHSIVLG